MAPSTTTTSHIQNDLLSSSTTAATTSNISTTSSPNQSKLSTSTLSTSISNRDWPQVISTTSHFPALASEWLDVTVRDSPVRLLPLHLACTLRPPLSAIRALLDASPSTASYEDRCGRLPLHWACDAGGAPSSVVAMLLDVYSEGSKIKEDRYGFLPLHVACYNDDDDDDDDDDRATVTNNESSSSSSSSSELNKVEVVKLLLTHNPDGAMDRDAQGWLPLHVACRTGASDRIVASLLSTHSHGSNVPDEHGRLPLHLACCRRDSHTSTVVRHLLQSNPEGPRHQERRHGCLPLHVACSQSSSSSNGDSSAAADNRRQTRPLRDVVDMVLDAFPAAAKIPDENGSLPLHVACRAPAENGIVSSLLRAFRDGAQVADAKSQRLPLHWACHSGASSKTIRLLLEAYPDGAKSTETKYNYLPLHVACLRGGSDGVIRCLLRAYPEGAKWRDKDRCLPIHLACRSGASAGAINMLLRCHPKSLEQRDGDKKTPMGIVMSSSTSLDGRCKEDMRRALEGGYVVPLATISENRDREISTPSLIPKSKPSFFRKPNLKFKKHPPPPLPPSPAFLDTKLLPPPKHQECTMCVICLENPVTFILYPCGHACLCDECATKERLKSLKNSCPVGRCMFQDVVRVYGNIVEA